MQNIYYPDSFPDIHKLSGHMHDLNKSLENPLPKSDWQPGDIVWVYIRQHQRILVGAITRIVDDTPNRNAYVKDVNRQPDEQDTTYLCDVNELFKTEDGLLKALFQLK